MLCCLFFGASSVYASYSVKKIFSFNRVGQVLFSPKAKKVSFIIERALHEKTKWRWQSSIYVNDLSGNTILIKKSFAEISSPVWSNDSSKIYYIAQGNYNQSIWMYNIKNHSNIKIYEAAADIKGFKLNPRKPDQLAFVAGDINKTSHKPVLINPAASNNDRIYLLGIYSQHVRPLTSANISITQLSANTLIDGGFSWSPDGKTIVYSYQPNNTANASVAAKLATYDLRTNKSTQWKYTERFTGMQPVYSPNGRWTAFRRSSRNRFSLSSSSYAEVCVRNMISLKTHCLANTFNQSPVILGWSKNSRSIYVIDHYKVDGPQIYQLSINNKYAPRLISNKNGYIDPDTVSLNANHNIASFSWQDVNQSPGIFYTNLSNFHLKNIAFKKTAINKTLGQFKVIDWRSTDGLNIQGELILPQHYNKKKTYPLIVIPHGGPSGILTKQYLGGCEEYGRAIVPNCSANLLSMGFVILKPNYRGSTGYGKSFRFINIGDLGGGDEQDIISGVNLLIKQKIADPKRMAIFGWSYGGYLTAWTISQTHRFKAAIDGDGLTDLISFTGTTDIPSYLVQYLGGTFWQKHSLYITRSPITFVNRIKTPVLILQGQNDQRVPSGQAFELYNDLKYQHKNAKLLISPGQGHVPVAADIIAHLIKNIDLWLGSKVVSNKEKN